MMAYHLEMGGMPLRDGFGVNCKLLILRRRCLVYGLLLLWLRFYHSGRYLDDSAVTSVNTCLNVSLHIYNLFLPVLY